VPFAHVSLWLAAVLIFAGLRFLNPLFIVLGAAAFSNMIFDLHAPGTGRDFSAARVASAACFTIAAIALALGQIGIRRPSYDRMLDALVAAMPLFGFLWMLSASMSDFSLPAEHAAARVHIYPAAALLLFGGVALIVGIRRRTHAPLAAFMVCAACLVYELRNLTGLSLEVRLIVAGTAVLALTMWLDRYLRTPRRAVISQKVAADGGAFDLLQLIGAVALTPPSNPRATPGFEGGGGTAGGGGASGNF
jgi:hypothetical protein